MIPLATIGFKLLGIGRAIGGAAKAAARWTLSDLRHIAIVALAVCAGVLVWQNSGLSSKVQKAAWREAGWRQFAYDVGYTSGKNRAKQIAMNQAVTDKQIQIERLNREKANLNAIAISNASNRYADNNRLSKVCPAYSSGTNTAAQDNSAKGDDGLQASAIVLGQSDFDVLNARAADAVRYEEWARSLVAAGLAVSAE